jgi:UDP-N-acetylmuramoyl-tripeptide--D-alanyl-D-alanine ligase
MPMFDANLLQQWTGGRWRTAAPPALGGVSIDSRTLLPGNIFVALRGARSDGHGFVQQAFARGAAAAVVGPAYRAAPGDGALLEVPEPARALRDMAAAYRRQLGFTVIGITGSVGKTTVKEMVADVLATRYDTARTRGNWNNDLGLPLSLLNLEPAARMGVFELGTNHPGELRALCAILRPDWGVVTAIAPVHLEYFKTEAGIVAEKAELLKSLPAVLRRDDKWYATLRDLAPSRVITVALTAVADYQGIPPAQWDGPAQVVERASGERLVFQMPLPGRHQLANALFAVAVGRAHGLAWDAIRRALEQFRPQPMRWECQTLNGILVINDAYNANPASMAAALRTFAEMPVRGRRWLVLAGMLELGTQETSAHQELGRQLAPGAWGGLIVVGELGAVIAAAAERAGLDAARIFRCRDQAQAAQRLCRDALPGDAVLLKASRGQRLEQVLAWWKQALPGKE